MRVAAGPWYEIAKVDHGLSRILERHVAPWMRCNMWLIHGRDRNLLIDSGMGLRPLKPEIAALGERPVTAVCTHCHFDHIGCAHEFDTRLGHALEAHDYAAPDLGRSCASSKFVPGFRKYRNKRFRIGLSSLRILIFLFSWSSTGIKMFPASSHWLNA